MSRLSRNVTAVCTTKGKRIPLFVLGWDNGVLVLKYVNGEKELGSITWKELVAIVKSFVRQRNSQFTY